MSLDFLLLHSSPLWWKAHLFLHHKISDIQTRRCCSSVILLSYVLHSQSLSHVWLFVTPYTVTCQAPLCMEFSRQEYWSGLPFPSPGDLPDSLDERTPRIEPASPALQVDSLPLSHMGSCCIILCIYSTKQIWDVIQLKEQKTKRNNQKNLKWDPKWKTMSMLIFRTQNINLFRTYFITINKTF